MLVLGCAVLINATSPTGCKFGGKEYAQGEVFVTGSGLNCARCQCGGGYGAGVGCLPLCGLSMVNCGGPYEVAYKKRHVASAPGCYCMDPYCKKIVGPRYLLSGSVVQGFEFLHRLHETTTQEENVGVE